MRSSLTSCQGGVFKTFISGKYCKQTNRVNINWFKECFPFHSSLIFGVWVCILCVLGVFWLHIWVFGGILDCIAMLGHFFLPLTLGPCECPTRQYLFAPNFPSCLCISAFYTPNCPCKICQKLHWQGFDMLHIFNRNMHIHLQRGDIIQNSNKFYKYFVTEMQLWSFRHNKNFHYGSETKKALKR